MIPYDFLPLFNFLAEVRIGTGGGLAGLVILVLDIIAIVSILGGRGSVGHKLLWTVVVLLLPCVGMVLYFLIGRSAADA